MSKLLPELSDPEPTLAPAWVALVAAWTGVLVLVLAMVFVFLPGSRSPRQELERATPYGPADRFLPVALYAPVVPMFLGIVVMWQMRKRARPLPHSLLMQRVQAWVGIWLALLAAAVVYIDVAVRGPP